MQVEADQRFLMSREEAFNKIVTLTGGRAAEELAAATRREGGQGIGTKFVLYRESHSKPKEKRIALVKDKKKKTV